MITATPTNSMTGYSKVFNNKTTNFGRGKIQQSLAAEITRFQQVKLSIFAPSQTKPGKCYLIACSRALLDNKNEKNIFKEAISQNPDGSYSVMYKGLKKSFPVYHDELNSDTNRLALEGDPTTRIFEVATRKMLLNEHFWKKYQKEPLKYYSASSFLKKLTGKKTLNTGEYNPLTLNNPLCFFNKKKAIKLLEKISDAGEGNFTAVAGTQLKKQPPPEQRKYDIRTNHYYVIKNVDKEKRIISVENPRLNEPHPNLTYDQFFEVFRSIVMLPQK